MNDDTKTPEPWSIRRWKQLKHLERMLIECESIDRGNCVLSRLKRIIAVAEKMRSWSDSLEESSFFHFLQEHALHGLKNRRRAKRKD